MNIKLLTFGVLVCTLFSCSKNTDDTVDPPPSVDSLPPLQLVKKIIRYQINGTGEVMGDSTAYTYDDEGRLTATIDLETNQTTRMFIYEGDEMVGLVDPFIRQGDTLHHPVTFTDNGNTILLDHTRPSSNGPSDTIQLTYKWAGDHLLESWTYLNAASINVQNFQKSIFTYDEHGNYHDENVVYSNGDTQWQMTALSFDDKKNFFRTLSRLNYIFIGWGFPYATRSVNNPLKSKWPLGELEFIWTYNDEGYPLTMRVKGEDFITAEFYYNR